MRADQNDVVAHLRRPAHRVTGLDVVNELRRVVVSGHVRPGTPIPAEDVARIFGVSRIPVREALKTLQAEGLLAHQPRGDYTVTELSPDELAENPIVNGLGLPWPVRSRTRNVRAISVCPGTSTRHSWRPVGCRA
jgi:DNA-binding transcriptional MocR family regulator